MESGCIVRVIRDFLTTTDGELCVTAGEYLQVIDRVDRHWVRCRKSRGLEGSVPSSHVTEATEIGQLAEGTEIFLAVSNFDAQQEGDLALKRGSLILGTERVDDDWYRGRPICAGLSGISGVDIGVFPTSYCWRMDNSYYVAEQQSKRNRVQKFAKVMHSMSAQLPGEMDLQAGQIVKIVEIIDKDWYRGEVDGRSGTFPSSFVRIVDAFPGSEPPPDADLKSYLDANKHRHNEYMNTKDTFAGLEECLKSMGQEALMKNFSEGLPQELVEKNDARHEMPKEIFEDEYFRRNLPATYGSVSGEGNNGLDDNDSEEVVYDREAELCSKGFRDLSENLGELYRRKKRQEEGETARAFAKLDESLSKVFASTAATASDQEKNNSSGLMITPDYNRVNENLSLFKSMKTENNSGDNLLMPTPDYNKISENLSILNKSNAQMTDEHSALQQPVDYSKLSENLGVLKESRNANSSFAQLSSPTEDQRRDGLDYNKLSENLSVFGKKDASAVGYTESGVNVRPYAIAKFNFVAQFDSELGLNEGDMVYLNRYVDDEWLEGQVDNQKGMFPINYVNIVVDCANNKLNGEVHIDNKVVNDTDVAVSSEAKDRDDRLKPDTFHKVLYTFSAQMAGDVTVSEDEVVRIAEEEDGNGWVRVETSTGENGVMPRAYLDVREEFDGRVQFDIDRLLNYRKEKIEEEASRPFIPPKKNPDADSLKFFDPLRSPDGDMQKAEEELEKRAREPKVISKPDNSVEISQKLVTRRSDETRKHDFKKPPRDLETLISSNLSKLRTLDSEDQSKNGNKKIEISSLVWDELRGKQKTSNPFKELQEKGSVKTDVLNKYDESNNGSTSKVANKLPGIDTPPKVLSSPKLPSKKSSPAPAPPRPPQPKRKGNKGVLLLPYNKPKAPKPPKPPPPKLETEELSITCKSVNEKEPLYSTVNKESSKISNKDTEAELDGEDDEEEKSSFSDILPPSFPAPTLPPTRPPLRHSESLPAKPKPEKEKPPFEITVKAQVHEYATPDDGVDETSSNLEEKEPLYAPTIPLRSSSIIARRGLVSRGETFRSALCSAELGPPEFPPDKKSPLSPPPSRSQDPVELPPKVGSLPCRSASVADSIKSRSVFYASVASERGYSPAMSSLHHSYETLNMSEVNSSSNNNEIYSPRQQQRKPSRPAPPVPVKEQFERSKEILFNSNKNNSGWRIVQLHHQYYLHHYQTHQPFRPRVRSAGTRRNLRTRKIHSLKRQIQIKEKMLEDLIQPQEQLLRELDMYQEIAVAKGEAYDRLNQKMDRCQESIETLSDEIQRLQACLADEELKLEEDSLEESRRRAEEESLRRQLEVQRREEEKRRREEKIKKNKEHRSHVIGELLQTESEFRRGLQMAWQAFGLDTPEMLQQRSVDVETLFGNMAEVIDISEKFLETLQQEVKSRECPAEQRVGRCFLAHADSMKRIYTDYCVNHDKAEQLLEKYDSVPEVQKLLQRGVETLQGQVACFNMGSILIKPVQRILKYPLMLNELIKCTEDDHADKQDLLKAVNMMADVATFINESKRRKDIVVKYKSVEDQTLSRKISKFTLHSIGKKSSRFSQKFLSTIGIDPMTRDYDFDELDRRFSHICHAVQVFCVDAQRFRENLHDVAISQFNVAENVADLYKERVHTREVERFRNAHRNILSTYWNQYNVMLESRVTKPLQQLLETFQGPIRLIQKRQDKHLDYSASMQKSERNRDPTKAKQFREEMEECRTTYEALNSQLVEELPKLLDCSLSIYGKCVTEFILLRKLFVGRVTRELLSLMDLPLLASTSGDILEVFLVKHSLVCNQLGRFSFSSKTFKPEDRRKHSHAAGAAAAAGGGQSIGQVSAQPQSSGLRTFLRGKYAAVKLYQARELHEPSGQPLDIGINPGDLVGVIQKKDPAGCPDRWFVDNGVTQGFVPSRVLAPIGENEAAAAAEKSRIDSAAETPQKQVVHAYDDVADDEVDEADVRNDLDDNSQGTVRRRPTRKAPPVVSATSAPAETINDDGKPRPGVQQTGEEELDRIEVVQEEENDTACTEANGTSNIKADDDPEPVMRERRVSHGYEEIAAASEGNSEPSQDLSPIYEEIHGGSRSTVSSSSCATSSSSSHSSTHGSGKVGAKGKFHYSLYAFTATDSTMLSVARGQVVRVIQVTVGEWWYVEDRHGNRGYVPHTYLRAYPVQGAIATVEEENKLCEYKENQAQEEEKEVVNDNERDIITNNDALEEDKEQDEVDTT